MAAGRRDDAQRITVVVDIDAEVHEVSVGEASVLAFKKVVRHRGQLGAVALFGRIDDGTPSRAVVVDDTIDDRSGVGRCALLPRLRQQQAILVLLRPERIPGRQRFGLESREFVLKLDVAHFGALVLHALDEIFWKRIEEQLHAEVPLVARILSLAERQRSTAQATNRHLAVGRRWCSANHRRRVDVAATGCIDTIDNLWLAVTRRNQTLCREVHKY